MGSPVDREKSLKEADRWALHALAVLGAMVGGFFGVLYAPDIQGNLDLFGVDHDSVGPALVIIAVAMCLGALPALAAAWWR